MVIFHSYVKLPEGSSHGSTYSIIFPCFRVNPSPNFRLSDVACHDLKAIDVPALDEVLQNNKNHQLVFPTLPYVVGYLSTYICMIMYVCIYIYMVISYIYLLLAESQLQLYVYVCVYI